MPIRYIMLLVFIVSAPSLMAQKNVFSEEKNIYDQIADIKLTTLSGQKSLSEIYGASPVLLALVFTRCTGVCNPFILRLYEDLKILRTDDKYTVLVMSFDPRDNIDDMKHFARRYGLQDNDQWIFGVTNQIAKMNNLIAFYPQWDEAKQQFDHEALLTGINREGYIIKKLTGIRHQADLALMLKEINGRFIPSYPLPTANTSFSCFTYNPTTGENTPSVGLIVLMSPLFITLLIVFIVFLGAQGQRIKKGSVVL